MAIVTPPENATNYAMIVPDADDESILDVEYAELRTIYETHGAILFRGFDVDLDILRTMTDRFCANGLRNMSGGREVVDDTANIQTVNLGNDVFPLHPEMAREPWKPDICFFACHTPPSFGGQTTLCDGIELVRHLPEDLVERMKSRRLVYRLPASDEELDFWLGTSTPTDVQLDAPPAHCPFTFDRESGRVFRSFTAPFFHKPMFQSDLAFGSFLLFAWFYQKQNYFPMLDTGRPVDERTVARIKRVSDELTVPIQWQKNDLVIVDNTRFMHGRNRSYPNDGRRILTYFGYVKSPRLTEDQFPGAPWRDMEVESRAIG